MRFLTLLKGNKLAAPLVCLAAIGMLAISELSYWYTSEYSKETVAILRAQTLVNALHERMLNAETGQRGFLLTGRPEYLQPYTEAVAPVTEDFAELRRRYMKRPQSLAMLDELEQLTLSKLKNMAQTLGLYKAGLPQAGLDIVLEGGSKGSMQRMRIITNLLLENEAENLSLFQSNLKTTLILGRVSISLFSIFCLFAIVQFLKNNLNLKNEQIELHRLLSLERDQLEKTVRNRTGELTRLARYLQTNIEDERSRLARNLHDDLGALLTSAKLDAARIKARINLISPEVVDLLKHLVENLDSSIALGRKIIEDLRPSALSNLGLLATLEILAREFAESSELRIHTNFEEVNLPADAQLMVYRLMQEACTNIMKYAKASNVWLSLGIVEGVIIASVRDDGVGFDTDSKISASYGLLGMRYRVEAANGMLKISSEPGQGTLIEARL
jgi:signal transduction histidine kinase